MGYEPVDEEDVFPTPHVPDWKALEAATLESKFSEESFNLLKEATQLVTVVGSMQPRTPITNPNEATLLGLVVKIAKLTKVILRDASTGDIGQQLSVWREFIEAMANLRWLMNDDGSGERYSMFIEDGLRAEKSMLESINKNISQRGGKALHIEKRMAVSITDTFKAAGIEDPDTIRSGKVLCAQGYPKIEKRIEELSPTAYVAYRGASAEIHGTWSDLFKHHLIYDDGEFAPDFDPPRRRPQALNTTITTICMVITEYARLIVDEYAAERVASLFENLEERNSRLVDMHEKYLAAKGEPKAAL